MKGGETSKNQSLDDENQHDLKTLKKIDKTHQINQIDKIDKIEQIEETANEDPKIKLFSPKVMFIFIIGVLRNLTGYYYLSQIKYIGTLYVNNDRFVTLAILFSLSINFVFRFGFGPIVKKINFFNTIYLCQFCSILQGVFGYALYLTNAKIFYVLFTFSSRATMALLFNINYTIPYKFFGSNNGLYLMKLLDFQIFPGFVIGSISNYVFVYFNIFHLLFVVFVLIDLTSVFLVSVFVKRFPKSGKETAD